MTDVARKRYVRLSILAVFLVVILLRVVACGPTTGSAPADASGGDGTGDGSSGAGSTYASFSIDGDATEVITPGAMVPLDLEFTNPHDVPMSVTGLVVSVHLVKAPNADDARPCSDADFALDRASSRLAVTLAAHSRSTLSGLGIPRRAWPHVGMLNRSVNQDGCKGATLGLDFTASGRLGHQ
jgi:hypothetical protein